MTPTSHLLMSWLCTVPKISAPRERRLIALSGVAPDLDGIGIIWDWISGKTHYYSDYHHVLGHGFIASIFIATLATAFAAQQRGKVFILSLFVVHLHILCDVIGSKGEDGYTWPISYFYPFNEVFLLSWSRQWLLNGWQNLLIFCGLLIISAYVFKKQKVTVLEVFHERLDESLRRK
ncbi:metal-dependent hydrolase [Algicola sagamiensis]|uniref:metal-dependent hydrolase n=1 Tax=Algicola sagamiensis TaxID=163869 RepID=UPI000364F6C2|nr:metal-dependent hydrolase [Algicola sagamiensis]